MEQKTSLGRPIRFGTFEVDPRAGELRKQGVKVKLQEQPLQVLAMLLDYPREVITREELKQRLWPANTFVDFENGLNKAINKLREALGDSAENARFVETLPRHGYRFIAPVEAVVPGIGGRKPSVTAAPSGTTVAGPPVLMEPRAAVSSPGLPEMERERTQRTGVRSLLAAVGVGAGILLALLFGLNVAGLRERLLSRIAAQPIQSVAVLPLENLSGDPQQEYFADGMTVELTTELGKISGLRVISRTSAMHYKGSHKSLPEIARELNVDAIVEGSVSRSGNQVRITAQLIRASTDQHLWARAYEHDLKDILGLQSEISRDIAEQVEIKLSPEGMALRSRPPQMNPEAYELYLKGRFYLAKRTEDSMTKAAEYFQEAIQKDPKSALAYSGLANAYGLLGSFGFLPNEEAIPRSKAAAMKAVALDDTLPEALTAMAALTDDGAESERLFRRAIQINPSCAQAHHWYARFLRDQGRMGEAAAEIEKARDLDPLSLIVNVNVGEIYFDNRQFDKAIEQLTRTLALDPNFGRTHIDLGQAYERVGRMDEAIAEFQKSRELGEN